MSDRAFCTGPVALTNAAANIMNCAVTSLAGPVGITLVQPVARVRKVTIVNKTAGAVTVSLYKGATGASAAGSEYLFNGYSIPANGYVERFCDTQFLSTDFLTGLASANTSLTIEIEGVIGFNG